MKLIRGHTEGCRVSHWWHGNTNLVFSICGRTWNHGKPLKELLDGAIEQLGVQVNTVDGFRLIENPLCPENTIFIGSSHLNVCGIAAQIAKDAKGLEK